MEIDYHKNELKKTLLFSVTNFSYKQTFQPAHLTYQSLQPAKPLIIFTDIFIFPFQSTTKVTKSHN